ncbi:coiled-coil domain-containing protein 38 [Anomaloglossus baeobatrachus]|uniref:coiled-coil domain-containing protein 38 n=1 Tax=Anomaloglossus baeobatrachus TaxID=238106 RepID=UPI003F504B56
MAPQHFYEPPSLNFALVSPLLLIELVHIHVLEFCSKMAQESTQKEIFFRDLAVRDTSASRAKSVSFSALDSLDTDAKSNENDDKLQLLKEYRQQSTPTPGCNKFRRQSLRDYFAQKKEMFHTQFSIDSKLDTIREMKIVLSKEKDKIIDAEQKLQEDTKIFEEFLKETDKNVAEASKLADKETKAKLEKIKEIQKVTAEIVSLRSDIAKCEETLAEYKIYEKFLWMLSPSEWQDAQNQKGILREAAKNKDRERKLTLPLPIITKRSNRRFLSGTEAKRDHGYLPRRKSSITESRRSSTRSPSEASTDERETQTGDSDNEEEPEIFFTDPQQLLQIFAELEEQNAILIKKAQELDETMQEVKERKIISEERMNERLKTRNEQKKKFSEALAREQEQIAELELKVQMFTLGNLRLEDQDKMLSTLKKKIADVYTCCIGEAQAAINPVQMLSSIENRYGDLQDLLESLPKEMVQVEQRAKQRERRMKIRQETLKDELLKQEQRMIRTLERATKDTCKTVTRKLMKRSEPSPQSRRKKNMDLEKLAAQKQEEYEYFFT